MSSVAMAEIEVERRARELGRVVGREPGPTLVVVGALHGNEPSGVLALERVLARLQQAGDEVCGELVALIGNREALHQGRRFVDRDLNRRWLPERMARLERQPLELLEAEDREQVELAQAIDDAFARARGTTFLLDFHSTSGPGPAWATIDDSLPNRSLALHLPVPIVLGLEETLSGTMLSFFDQMAQVKMGFEGGQHDAESSVDHAEAAIWICLAASGFLPAQDWPEVEHARETLGRVGHELPRVVEIRHRHAVEVGDGFVMAPGFVSFQAVAKGELLGCDRSGDIVANERGLVLMPLYQKQGEDGFFLVREFRPTWLWLSEKLRRMGADRIVHWLPGIERHPDEAGKYIVNRRVARWFALEILHLLGFRRHGEEGDRLTVARRPEHLRTRLDER